MTDGAGGDTSVQPRDNLVIPFQIEGLGIRGRIVRLGTLATDILLRHNHPEPVSLLLAEALPEPGGRRWGESSS